MIANCLAELGFFLGYDLNKALDNLWFTLLFKRADTPGLPEGEFKKLLDIFLLAMQGENNFSKSQTESITCRSTPARDDHSIVWLEKRVNSLLSPKAQRTPNAPWGWKEPNSHIFLEQLKNHIEGMKYIHVARNGLDMAYSKNQSQLRLWGAPSIDKAGTASPYYSLKYWCSTHSRVLKSGSRMGNNFLFLNYDDFCTHPSDGIDRLGNFLGLEMDNSSRKQLTQLIDTPDSIGRFKQYGTTMFDEMDIAYVRELGFDTSTATVQPPSLPPWGDAYRDVGR